MKLVNLDRLKWPNIAIFDMNLHGECVPMVRLNDLQALAPLEDVVPVEWLRNVLEEAKKFPRSEYETIVAIPYLIKRWQKEQEAGR